ncbi:hypothetical protein [Nocardioides nematodiphilus]|uniref:hypothetical protein n=1 Tax=Nocardioides nematodiphilus TaxID=2849669 RepID=UPI001CD9E97B|nr:hypothetical protein [Nocardioides nematodiphilus]MCA1982192.1 hypothetical protein [Nocardioides nematodiphilus]
MDELDLIATDPLESPAPTEAEIATALGFIADLLALTPTTTRAWEQRDHGNGLTYRLWDALALVHGTAAAHEIDEQDALHAVQAAVRRIKTDEEIIDVLVEHLPEIGVGDLRELRGRSIEIETHHPLNLGAYALSVVDSDAMQEAYARMAATLQERSLGAPPAPAAA